MHEECYEYVRRVLTTLPHRRHVVEFGSRDINGSVRPLFQCANTYLGVDIIDGPGVDLVQDAAMWDTDERFDTVLCLEVLEHTYQAGSIIDTAHRILDPGGVLIVTAATDGRPPHSAIDTEPIRPEEFYRNVTAGMLADWLKPFSRYNVEIDSVVCDIRAVAWK